MIRKNQIPRFVTVVLRWWRQVRVPSAELPLLLQDLSSMKTAWEAVQQRFPAQEAPAAAS